MKNKLILELKLIGVYFFLLQMVEVVFPAVEEGGSTIEGDVAQWRDTRR